MNIHQARLEEKEERNKEVNWVKTKENVWWNQSGKTSRVIEVWEYEPKVWFATINNSYLAKETTKEIALKEAFDYMKRHN